jgi:hypothetical protein
MGPRLRGLGDIPVREIELSCGYLTLPLRKPVESILEALSEHLTSAELSGREGTPQADWQLDMMMPIVRK